MNEQVIDLAEDAVVLLAQGILRQYSRIFQTGVLIKKTCLFLP
ncbi:hypothetical protein [Scytonema hofmannii]|nr:hypothetical protein [Scytonema hofmannii]